MTGREIAFEILLSVERGGYIKEELNQFLPYFSDKRDIALVEQIVKGTVEREIYLDSVLKKYIHTAPSKIKKATWIILRMSLYQIHYLDKIPHHAIVSEAVSLAKDKVHPRVGSFVNGVLRAIIRDGESAFEIQAESENERNALKYSMPLEWVEYFSIYEGLNVSEFLASLLKDAPFTLRAVGISREVLLEELQSLGYRCFPTQSAPQGITLESPKGLFTTKPYRSGQIYVQDEGSQLVVEAFCSGKKISAIDLCAAPGGKTFQLREKFDGTIVACDKSRERLSVLKENAQRLALPGEIEMRALDGRMYVSEWKESFQRVLIDAPCSGLGLIRRKPEIKKRMSLSEVKELAKIQKEILSNGAKYLTIEGELIYSTCTLTREENEDVVQSFLEENPNFEQVEMKRLWPHETGTDGFTITKLKRIR